MNQTNAYIKNITAILIFGSVGIFVQAIPLRSNEIVAARTILGSLFLCVVLVMGRWKTDWTKVKKNLVMLLVSGVILGSNRICGFSAGKTDCHPAGRGYLF